MFFHGLLLGCLVLAGCQSADQKAANDDPPPVQNGEPAAGSTPGSISVEEMKRLYDSCDYVDVIFYSSSLSMSQNNQAGIRQTILFVSPQPATTNPQCSPVGRISFMIQGNIETEADIYMGQGCNYFAFLRDGNIYAVNQMTPRGLQLFTEFLKSDSSQDG